MNYKDDILAQPELVHTKEAGLQVISIKGKLTYGTTQHTKDTIKSIFDSTAEGFIVDLSDVSNIDSTGFGVLINFAKKIAEIDRRMAIIVTNAFIFDLFKISKFHLVFPIVRTKEEAVKVLKEAQELPLSLREY